MKIWLPAAALFVIAVSSILFFRQSPQTNPTPNPDNITKTTQPTLPIFISELAKRAYPASPIEIVETLSPGSNYNRYLASYASDNLKIYGLFTIPKIDPPAEGFPTIVFLHGYLEPKTYQTLERYVAYQDSLAKSGFVTFKPDLRGHGKSEGAATTAAFSEDYVVDALSLASALKIHPDVNPDRLGVWGHSMGGGIGLRAMVVSKDFKAGIFWAGVVGNYEDLLQRYQKRASWLTAQASSNTARQFFEKYGSPSANPTFWNQLDPYAHLANISGPVQLHHGTADDSVPIEFSRHLTSALQIAGKTVEFFEYPGSDHNLAQSFSSAMSRSADFFKKNL